MMQGHCGETTDGQSGDCIVGDYGMERLSHKEASSWDEAFASCKQRCQSCDRCRYVSVSLAYKDCSWYAACDLTKTKRFSDFRSVAVPRDATALAGRPRDWKPFVNRSSLVATRHALGRLQPQKGRWPWVQPTARASVALVMYGKIGTLHQPSWYTSDDKAEAAVVHLAYASA